MSKFAIEKLLKPDHVYLFGVYVQTCAHIEMLTCVLVTALEGKRADDPDWLETFRMNRGRQTGCLIKRLRKSSDHVKDKEFANYLTELSDWLQDDNNKLTAAINDRHRAVHGAFVSKSDGGLVTDLSPRNEREIGIREFDHEQIQQALNGADNLYLSLLSLIVRTDLTLKGCVYSKAMGLEEKFTFHSGDVFHPDQQ